MTDLPPASPSPARSMFASRGWRFAIMIGLTVLMVVPLFMVSLVIEDRVSYQRGAVWEVSRQWGGPIQLSGPVVVIPVDQERTRKVTNEAGVERDEVYIARVAPVVLLPEQLAITADGTSEIRRRGIFEVPVFTTDVTMRLDFDTGRVAEQIGPRETVLWDKARLVLLMPETRNFSGAAVLRAGERAIDLEPGTPFEHRPGIQALLGDPRSLGALSLEMGLNGAEELALTPAGRQTDVALASDWPHPSFTGAFLPKTREVRADGFSARWEVPHLARDLPQVSRGDWQGAASFGVRFYNPVDFYQKVQRAAKYGILFIALTFLSVFLMERLSSRPVHAAQFVLIGVAQCVFFLLLLSIAEQIGFTLAYLVAAGATIGLIGIYARRGLGLHRHAVTLAAGLGVLYATLYLILRSTDYALLAGSVLSFVAVALVMLLTRGDDWSSGGRPATAAAA